MRLNFHERSDKRANTQLFQFARSLKLGSLFNLNESINSHQNKPSQ